MAQLESYLSDPARPLKALLNRKKGKNLIEKGFTLVALGHGFPFAGRWLGFGIAATHALALP